MSVPIAGSMAVGASVGSDQIDNMITSFAVRLRDLMTDIAELSLSVNGQGAGLAYLQGKGYSSTPNPDNPGGVSDAELAQNMIGYLNTSSALYFGSASQPSPFNFHQELSQVWAGQIGS